MIDPQARIFGRPMTLDAAPLAIVADIGGHSYGLLVEAVADITLSANGAHAIRGRIDPVWEPFASALVERDGQILGGGGVAALENAEPEVCELRKMYFLPQARGIGAGSAMMKRCLEAARSFGFRRCYLETLTGMDAARALYRRSGFTPLDAPMGGTGHFSCDQFYILDL